MNFFMQGTADTPAELFVFGDVVNDTRPHAADVSPASVQGVLEQMQGDELVIHINSYGGITSAGIAIYNLLRSSGKRVTTINESFACSAASMIFMAGSRRVMRSSSLLMIHNAWTQASGNADELRNTAEVLDAISATAARIYAENSKLTDAELSALLDAEAWITPEMALVNGMATEIAQAENTTGVGYSSAFRAIQRAVMGHETPASRKKHLFDEIFGGFA